MQNFNNYHKIAEALAGLRPPRAPSVCCSGLCIFWIFDQTEIAIWATFELARGIYSFFSFFWEVIFFV